MISRESIDIRYVVVSALVLLSATTVIVVNNDNKNNTQQRGTAGTSNFSKKLRERRMLHEPALESSFSLDRIGWNDPKSVSMKMPQPPPPTNDERTDCSCNSDPTINLQCCNRRLLAIHGMGSMEMEYIQRVYFPNDVYRPTLNHWLLGGDTIPIGPGGVDYREVIMMRHWYDAIVLGYMYHKGHLGDGLGSGSGGGGGGECGHDSTYQKTYQNLEKKLNNNFYTWTSLTVPVNGRNLCTYLSEESERNGMRLYTQYTLVTHFRPWLELIRTRKNMNRAAVENGGPARSSFACYESMATQETRDAFIGDIRDHLYPGRENQFMLPKSFMVESDNEYDAGREKMFWENIDSIDDEEELKRLYLLVKDIDETFHKGIISKASVEFGCPSKIMEEERNDKKGSSSI